MNLNSNRGTSLTEVLLASVFVALIVSGFAMLFSKGHQEAAGALDRMSSQVEKNGLFGLIQSRMMSSDIAVVHASTFPGEAGALGRFPALVNETQRTVTIGGTRQVMANNFTMLFAEAKPAGMSTVCTTTPSEYWLATRGSEDLFRSEEEAEALEAEIPNVRIIIFQLQNYQYGYVGVADQAGNLLGFGGTNVPQNSQQIRIRNSPISVGLSGALKTANFFEGDIDLSQDALYLLDNGIAYGAMPVRVGIDGNYAPVKPLAPRSGPSGLRREQAYLGLLPQNCLDRLAALGPDVLDGRGLGAIFVVPLNFHGLLEPSSTPVPIFPTNYLDDSTIQGARLGKLVVHSLGSRTNSSSDRVFALGPCKIQSLSGRPTHFVPECSENRESFKIENYSSINVVARYSVALGGQTNIHRYVLSPTQYTGSFGSHPACQGSPDCGVLPVTLAAQPILPRVLNTGENYDRLLPTSVSSAKNLFLISLQYVVELAGKTEVFNVTGR
jgi:hypothetical protein